MPDTEKIVKVKITEPSYDHTVGKMRKDGVYEFPQEQAIRYVRAGVAKPAAASAKTAREEDREAQRQINQARQSVQDLDQEMSAAWDIDVRDLERAEWGAEAADEAAEAAHGAVDRAKNARKLSAKAPDSPEPGEVHSQGPIRG
jgi:hypothetical protein